jgi:excisionase family DNA binding protein
MKQFSVSESSNPPSLLGQAILDAIRQAVREEIQAAGNGRKETELLTPEELADKLKLPLSWVYEQSRQGNIPTHRLGRYLRFELQEVLNSQPAKRSKEKDG